MYRKAHIIGKITNFHLKINFFWHPEHLWSYNWVHSILTGYLKKVVQGFLKCSCFGTKWQLIHEFFYFFLSKTWFLSQVGSHFGPKNKNFKNPCTTFLKQHARMLCTQLWITKCSGCQNKQILHYFFFTFRNTTDPLHFAS